MTVGGIDVVLGSFIFNLMVRRSENKMVTYFMSGNFILFLNVFKCKFKCVH